MRHFYAILEQDGHSAYGITFPDLPGCFSAADQADAILPTATAALKLWFESRPIVEATELDEMMVLASDALFAGATLLSVPFVTNDHEIMRARLSIERSILTAIDKAASEQKLTRSAFLEQARRNEITGAHRWYLD